MALAKEGALVIDLSTVGPEFSRHAGTVLQRRGIQFVDALVSGGDVGALNRTVVMAGGSDADVAEAAAVLEPVGRACHRCGPIDAGQSMKLVNQVLCALNTIAVATRGPCGSSGPRWVGVTFSRAFPSATW